MGKENIEKYSARYALVKQTVAFWHDNIFYRKIIVMGAENINPDHHLIFAPNHQNALMDALAVLFTHKGQPVFLARADIFKKKIIASLLYFLKILPVYRIRYGFSTLKSNDEMILRFLRSHFTNNVRVHKFVTVFTLHFSISEDANVRQEYFQLIFSVKKIRPSLTTSKYGLEKYNIHLETSRI